MISSFYFDDAGERRECARGHFASITVCARAGVEPNVGGDDGRRVQVVVVSPGSAALLYDATSVSPAAVDAAFNWLRTVEPTRVAMVDRSRSHPHPEICDRFRASERLLILYAARKSAPRFTLREINTNGSYFGTRWEAAQEILNAGLDLDTQSHILSKLFQSHFVLTERDPSSGHFVLAEAGAALDRHMHTFGALKIGRPFNALEDRQFGTWIADGLRAFHADDRPVVQQLDIRVESAKAKRGVVRYTRLVIPYRRFGREQLMTAAAMET